MSGIGFDQPEGTCGASKAELVESRTEHRDLLLTPGERAANDVRFVFVFLAEAGRPRLVLDP